jgi:predicted small integral membrane protein
MPLAIMPATLFSKTTATFLEHVALLIAHCAVLQVCAPHLNWEMCCLDLDRLQSHVVFIQVLQLETITIWVGIVRLDGLRTSTVLGVVDRLARNKAWKPPWSRSGWVTDCQSVHDVHRLHIFKLRAV